MLQLGVNGYSFIVDNNGHVLYHPDLRPLVRLHNRNHPNNLNVTFQQNNELYEDTLEPQYISVDLTEVELVENENGPRSNNSILLDVSLIPPNLFRCGKFNFLTVKT